MDLFGKTVEKPAYTKARKDWVGDRHSTFVTLGASNHTDSKRAERDYYATDPAAAEWLIKIEPAIHDVWENACGECHLAEVFHKAGLLSKATDIVDRGHILQTDTLDFLKYDIKDYRGSIVTNPPYSRALEFVQHSIDCIADNELVCMFLKLTFCEGQRRREFFDSNPPVRIWVSSSRIVCAANGEFAKINSSASCYAWFVWQKGYRGDTTLKWFN